MQEQPTSPEILETVAAYLRDVAMPQLEGHAAFTARVAANAVDLVRREIELREASDCAEKERLVTLLGHDGELEKLNADLAAAIREDRMDIEAPKLLSHLWQTSLEKLAIDQPRYASYRAALEETPEW